MTTFPLLHPVPPKRARAIPSSNVHDLNKLELEYEKYLWGLMLGKQIEKFWVKPMNLWLAPNKCFYRPDFMVQMPDGTLQIHETKGHWEDDALVKIKVAASLYPFKFVAIQKIKGLWSERWFS